MSRFNAPTYDVLRVEGNGAHTGLPKSDAVGLLQMTPAHQRFAKTLVPVLAGTQAVSHVSFKTLVICHDCPKVFVIFHWHATLSAMH